MTRRTLKRLQKLMVGRDKNLYLLSPKQIVSLFSRCPDRAHGQGDSLRWLLLLPHVQRERGVQSDQRAVQKS